jgi:putative ABC transport system permease protein
MWVGLDQEALRLKPWWHVKEGASWFPDADSVILGTDAAELEMRAAGDRFFSPEAGLQLKVTGVLERSGTSDDSLLFVPLATAQRMFNEPGKLTAIAIRLHDPVLLREASKRLQQIPGAQVVTIAEMMGVFLSLVGSANTLMRSIGVVALAVGLLSVLNTLLAAVVERAGELAVMRALGASRRQILVLIVGEATLLGLVGSTLGVILALAIGSGVENVIKGFLPLAPTQSLMSPTPNIILRSLGLGALAAFLAGLYPGWRASLQQPAGALKGE